MGLRFFKYEGTANDFVVLERSGDGPAVTADDVRALCDRHRGVGADGVLLVDLDGPRPSMRVVNADGSVPQMCGNGLRCVARHLDRTGRAARDFVVDTDAGPHRCEVDDDGVAIEMRVPSLVPAEVPVRADAPLVDAPFDVDGERLQVTAVSMGNPHVVTFDPVGARRATLGPRIGADPRFPEGVNVGFATLCDGRIDLHVFERGAGFTQACGTGACAAAVAAVETGRLPRNVPITVRLPGGDLEILVGAPGSRVRMRGPARFVFEGVLADRVAP